MASEWKDKGNAAFSAQQYEEAVSHFGKAIELDAANHVLFSNRSAAYAALHQYDKALEDANECVRIKPDWAKGYSRVGAAQFGLKDFEGAVESYGKGLKLEPTNQALLSGLRDAQEHATRSSASKGLASLFQRPDLISIIMGSQDLQPFIGQQDFMQMVQHLQRDPSSFAQYQHDHRCALLVQELLMATNPEMFRSMAESQAKSRKEQEERDAKRREEEAERARRAEEAKKPKLPENDEEIAALEDTASKCEAYKNKGTVAYKKRDFPTAVKYYTLAYESDDTNVACLTNRAAVHFESGNLDEAEKDCREAISRGRELRSDFKLIARAYERLGNIFVKRDDIANAIKEYENAQMEHRTEPVENRLKDLRKQLKLRQEESYIDVAKAAVEKEAGNALVKEGKWVEAISKYDEAIRRNPKDHTIYSNRALVFLKLMEPQRALLDCNKCIALEPTFVRAYLRRANAYSLLKELTLAYDDFHHASELDPDNNEAIEGMQRVQITATSGERDPTVTENALKDPSVQAILMDPIMKGILKDLSTDPSGVQRALQDPAIKSKMLKLIIAGIVQIGGPGRRHMDDD